MAEYSVSGTLLRRYAHGAVLDEPLVWYEGSTTTDRRWLLGDERGSIIAETDGAGAASIYAYDVYGIPKNDIWTGSRFRYTGQIVLDAPAKLYHYKARVYDPKIGRFFQTDPIGYEDQLNLYAYVGNDPVNGTDPTGMEGVGCWTVPGGCAPPPPSEEAAEIVVTGTRAVVSAPGVRVSPVITGGLIRVLGAVGSILSLTGDTCKTCAVYNKPPADASNPSGGKAPGKPGDAEGFKDPKKGAKWGRGPNGQYGWIDDKGNVWVPSGPEGSPNAHGGPHWDVQKPDGGYTNIYPGGRER